MNPYDLLEQPWQPRAVSYTSAAKRPRPSAPHRADEFARIVANIDKPSTSRDDWHASWAEHLKTCGPWEYEHPSGGIATFRPSRKTLALLAELVRIADEDGLAAATYATLSLRLRVAEPASLASHIRALRDLGAIERYTRGRKGNLYRLALERLPSPVDRPEQARLR